MFDIYFAIAAIAGGILWLAVAATRYYLTQSRKAQREK